MRELLETALYQPTTGRFKVYIIDEVHMLSRSAFNAMLKTLEEPPAHVKFVLATTDPQKIPVTVLSRCLQFALKQMTPQQIRSQLERVLGTEAVAFEPAALGLLARAARGSMRDSLSLLDQAIVHGGGQVNEASVREMLGIVDSSYLFTLAERVAAGDGPGLMAQADTIDARGLSFDAALQDLGSLLHRIALAQTIPDALADDEPERARLLALAEALSPEDVQLHYQIALRGRADLALAPDDYAGFTMTLMRMLSFRPVTEGAPASGAPVPRPAGASSRFSTPAGAGVALAREKRPDDAAPSAPPALNPGAATAPLPAAGGLTRERWPDTVAALKLGGMARMLAQHCELQSQEGNRLTLAVPAAHRHLLEPSYREKFTAALQERFPGVRVEYTTGETEDHTLAAKEARETAVRQRGAVEAIDSDPFVRELVENFDARLVDGSVRPVPRESP